MYLTDFRLWYIMRCQEQVLSQTPERDPKREEWKERRSFSLKQRTVGAFLLSRRG